MWCIYNIQNNCVGVNHTVRSQLSFKEGRFILRNVLVESLLHHNVCQHIFHSQITCDHESSFWTKPRKWACSSLVGALLSTQFHHMSRQVSWHWAPQLFLLTVSAPGADLSNHLWLNLWTGRQWCDLSFDPILSCWILAWPNIVRLSMCFMLSWLKCMHGFVISLKMKRYFQ